MPTVSAGSSATETLTARSTITISAVDGAERSNVFVLRSGAQIFGDRVSMGQSLGPFLSGDVVTIAADFGALDYTVVSAPLVGDVFDGAGNIAFTAAQAAALTAGVLSSPPMALSKWTAALARPASNPARVMWVGDSNVAGEGAGTNTLGLDGARPLSMATRLATLAGWNNGAFFGDQNVTTGSVAVPTYDPRLTLGTGWAPDSAISTVGGRFLVGTAAAAGKLGFNPGTVFDRFDVYHPVVSTGNTAVGVWVDGVQVDTFSEAGSNAQQKRSYTVSRGTHLIEFSIGATGTAFIQGVVTWDSTADVPIQFINGVCAGTVANATLATNPYSALNASVSMAPDFCIVYLNINDLKVPTANGTYRASMETLVAAMNATANGVLTLGYPSSTAATTTGQMDQYGDLMRGIAADYGWGFYDGRPLLGYSNTGATARGTRFDNDHPNLVGHNAFALGLYNYLASSGFVFA